MELQNAVLAELQTQRRPMRVAELAERFDRLHAEIMIALEKLSHQGFVEMRSDGSWAVRK
jgi:predicted transcriptional regulator